MRIYASDENHPAYRIFVDGVEITPETGSRPFAADDEQGWVDAYTLNAEGWAFVEFPCEHRVRVEGCVCEKWINRIATHRLTGHVEIRE